MQDGASHAGKVWCGACLEMRSIVVQQIMAAFLCGWRWWRSDTFVSSNSLSQGHHWLLIVMWSFTFCCCGDFSANFMVFGKFSACFCRSTICSITKSVCQIQRLFPGRFHNFCTAAGLPQFQGWCTYLLKIFDNCARHWSWPRSQTDKKK